MAWGPRKAWQLECISLWFHKYSLFPRYSHSLEGLLQSPDLNAICVLMTPQFLPPALTIFMYPAVYLIFLCLGLTRMSLILHFVWYVLILYSPCWEADWHAVSSVNLLISNLQTCSSLVFSIRVKQSIVLYFAQVKTLDHSWLLSFSEIFIQSVSKPINFTLKIYLVSYGFTQPPPPPFQPEPSAPVVQLFCRSSLTALPAAVLVSMWSIPNTAARTIL